MKNVFCLPKNFTLPGDRAQVENPCTEEQMNDLDTRLQEVKDKIIAVSWSDTVKLLNFGKPEIFAVIYLKFEQRGQIVKVFCQNGANSIANSEDPDQTAPLEAV